MEILTTETLIVLAIGLSLGIATLPLKDNMGGQNCSPWVWIATITPGWPLYMAAWIMVGLAVLFKKDENGV
jgi:hypothetical protein